MRKRELERARSNFNTGLSTKALRERVAEDLQVVRDAYTTAETLMQKIDVLLANVEHDEKPTKALRELAASLKDTAGTLVALRQEARASIAAHVGAAQAQGAAVPVPVQHVLPPHPDDM